jgi:hypothetical protein
MTYFKVWRAIKMSTGGNFFDINRMRIEIAVLQEDISRENPGTAKFKIPVIMTEDTVAHITTNNSNILNRTNGNLANAYVNIENTIDLYVPQEYTQYYDVDTIPAGTRFLVAFVGGNVNDIRIIGRYDYTIEE